MILNSTIVLGVNDDKYDSGEASRHLERVLHHELPRSGRESHSGPPSGIVSRESMTTIHSYTNDQVILDFPHN